MNVEKNTIFFRELIQCGDELASWVFDSEGNTLYSNSSDELAFNTLFTVLKCKDYMLTQGKEHDAPLILSTSSGLVWISVYDKKQAIYHSIGPTFCMDISQDRLKESLRTNNLSIAMQNKLFGLLKALPIVSAILFQQYALMLYYCITGIKLKPSDIRFQEGEQSNQNFELHEGQSNGQKAWRFEQELLRMVREGNLNYRHVREKGITISNGIGINVGDPIRRAKDTCIVFISLCTRAAIDGGLPPDTAYAVGDQYLQSIQTCKILTELTVINSRMYDDFVRRVHAILAAPKLSSQIQSCCDYIHMHIEQKLSIELLASQLGYSKYYLTQKFKNEVGVYLNSFINHAKIEHAKLLLKTTELSIQEISEALHFGTRSYFADTFQKTVGMTPRKFKENRTFYLSEV
ncbi:helix-turn-helix transcriptional regulator [Paenibacillus sinopodophylli]|uniref:helix-turn-helix transcriptional regulator n=1 Tax=Paenibacillus sinopodophylli TaxID=1837342 RepID=UPI00110C9C52|nr:AraC family transcriptional regulator [Paenibacillus sinopodophylli]